jgi:uncharacterized protein YndB with AHSA1/START domain
VFSFFTDAPPVRVWQALTDPAQTRIYLEGMALQSDWVVGSAIFAGFRGEPTQLGEVLCVQAHTRLSYVVRPPAASAVYLTWLLRRRAEGCICSLQIDEGDTSDFAELEDVWLPIMAGLQRTINAVPDENERADNPEAIL